MAGPEGVAMLECDEESDDPSDDVGGHGGGASSRGLLTAAVGLLTFTLDIIMENIDSS